MPSKKIFKIAGCAIILLFFTVNISSAFDDGFGPAKKIEGKHFIIYYSPQLEVSGLAQQLNIRPKDQLLAGGAINKEFSSEAELANMVDTLFVQVCDTLDMQLYSYQGSIKVCRDSAQLNQIYQNFFSNKLKTNSFYVYSLNTIYTSAENFRPEIIGHEIAHALMCHYFVVSPSVKIQEVLATYVAYQLRRAGQ